MKDVRSLWRRLWPAVRDGNTWAFDRLIEHTHRRYCWYVYHWIGDWDDAQDLVQRAWWKLWQHRHAITRDPMVWFYVTLRHLCVDQQRRRSRRLRLLRRLRREPMPSSSSSPGLVMDFWRLWDQTRGTLGVQQQEVFWLHDVLGFPADQIAQLMGIHTSTVRSHLSLARGKLRRAFVRLLPNPSPEAEQL